MQHLKTIQIVSLKIIKIPFSELNFWSTLTHFNIPKDVEFSSAMSGDDFIYLTANHRNDLYKFDPDKSFTKSENEKLEFEHLGKFCHSPQNVCLIEEIIYNFSDDEKPTVEIFDVKKKEFKVVWQDEIGTMEFSSNFSFGCFPLVTF